MVWVYDMGIYDLDGSAGFIIVDGHVCTKVRGDVYKVVDGEDYFVNINEWRSSENNAGLYAIIKIKDIEDPNGEIEYLSTGSREELGQLMKEVRHTYDSDLLLTYATHGCIKFDGYI